MSGSGLDLEKTSGSGSSFSTTKSHIGIKCYCLGSIKVS
jgi:hypothetical protein